MKNLFTKQNNSVTLTIDDEIGFWGVNQMDFKDQLDSVGDSDIELNISSFGGAVSDAKAIYNMLKSHKGKVTANIYGDSASSATIIALAADEVVMADNVFFLVHNVWGQVTGNSEDLQKAAKEMDREDINIANIYAQKTGVSVEEIMSLMSKEDWITASEAKELGFVDRVVDSSEILNREDLVLQNCADQKLQEKLINKINKQNQFIMTEDDKSVLGTLKDDIKEMFNFKKSEDTKNEVDAIKADVDARFTAMNEANEAYIEETNTAHKAELDALNAEIEKLTNESSDVEGEDTAEVVEEVILEASKLSPIESALRERFSSTLNLFKK